MKGDKKYCQLWWALMELYGLPLESYDLQFWGVYPLVLTLYRHFIHECNPFGNMLVEVGNFLGAPRKLRGWWLDLYASVMVVKTIEFLLQNMTNMMHFKILDGCSCPYKGGFVIIQKTQNKCSHPYRLSSHSLVIPTGNLHLDTDGIEWRNRVLYLSARIEKWTILDPCTCLIPNNILIMDSVKKKYHEHLNTRLIHKAKQFVLTKKRSSKKST